jgi:hypothetical protein
MEPSVSAATRLSGYPSKATVCVAPVANVTLRRSEPSTTQRAPPGAAVRDVTWETVLVTVLTVPLSETWTTLPAALPTMAKTPPTSSAARLPMNVNPVATTVDVPSRA